MLLTQIIDTSKLIGIQGGIDSCATAVVVYSMCRMVYSAIQEGNETVVTDVKRLLRCRETCEQLPDSPEKLCSRC